MDYKIAISEASPENLIIYVDVAGTSFIPGIDLVSDRAYRWKVKARNSAGETWSQILDYTICMPSSNAAFVAQGVPATLVAGESADVWVRMRNTGSTTWTQEGRYRLAAVGAESYWGLVRVDVSRSVAPGEEETFNFTISAPSEPRGYNFQWRMIQEDVALFGDSTPNVVVQVVPRQNDASYVDQGVPTSMVTNESTTVWVKMYNAGNTTWTPGKAYRLAAVGVGSYWGLVRVDVSRPVPPGDIETFSFTITASSDPGDYNFQWRMVQEDVELFGDHTPNVAIAVRSP